jgi:hypothetical protein
MLSIIYIYPGPSTLKSIIHARTLAPLQQRELQSLQSLLPRAKVRELQGIQYLFRSSDSSGSDSSSSSSGSSSYKRGDVIVSSLKQQQNVDIGKTDDISPPVSLNPDYSMILFGPPGTAKTTICTRYVTTLYDAI